MIKWRAKYQVSTKQYSYELVMDAITAAATLPALKRERKREAKLYEKYKDIHESGEADEKQQTLMMKHGNAVRTLDMIIETIEPQLNMKGGAQ